MQTVVVTGASTGIGAATARVLTRHGWRVFGSVRRLADGERLTGELGPNFAPLVFDVTDEAGVRAAAEEVSAALNGQTLFGLVNNAGIAVPGPLLYLRPEELRRQLDVNLVGQLVVTQAFAGLLGADRSRTGVPGRIVMMSSVGGRNGSPFIGAYNSSKFGLEGFSESLRRELMLFGIDVIIIAPGVVATPIWDKADALDPEKFSHTPYFAALIKAKEVIATGKLGLPAERIGEAVVTALTSSRPKTRYTITATPVRQLLADLLPKRVLDRIVANRLGLKPDRSRPA
jgi:NAD(P)-dependent dehydrogenase (short-subunit alcohol dehydrogenase family)